MARAVAQRILPVTKCNNISDFDPHFSDVTSTSVSILDGTYQNICQRHQLAYWRKSKHLKEKKHVNHLSTFSFNIIKYISHCGRFYGNS